MNQIYLCHTELKNSCLLYISCFIEEQSSDESKSLSSSDEDRDVVQHKKSKGKKFYSIKLHMNIVFLISSLRDYGLYTFP